jgi:glutamine synthetase
MQFYLFKTDDNGESTGVPYDKAGYMDIAPLDKGENVRREICLTLEQMGIKPESSHHEAGPGQNQIDFRYADPITAADNTVTFRSVVRTLAARNGLYADFSPKPIQDQAGSALHITLSVKSNSGDDVTDSAIAGILHNIAGMTVFLNPTDGSYLRFGQQKAPKYITWSENNRAQLISIRHTQNGDRCAQLRSPDPEANPYLAYALMIYAVLDGIENQRALPRPVDEDIWLSQGEIKDEPERLPDNLEKARMEAKSSHLIQQFIPSPVIRLYCAN